MHLPLAQSLLFVSTSGAGWLMLQAGFGKRILRRRELIRCAACGKRRAGGRCPCAGG